jgi:hypothetical protein
VDKAAAVIQPQYDAPACGKPLSRHLSFTLAAKGGRRPAASVRFFVAIIVLV